MLGSLNFHSNFFFFLILTITVEIMLAVWSFKKSWIHVPVNNSSDAFYKQTWIATWLIILVTLLLRVKRKWSFFFFSHFFSGFEWRMWSELVQGRTQWERWLHSQELHRNETTSVSWALLISQGPYPPISNNVLKLRSLGWLSYFLFCLRREFIKLIDFAC